jgi:hypothetical protein
VTGIKGDEHPLGKRIGPNVADTGQKHPALKPSGISAIPLGKGKPEPSRECVNNAYRFLTRDAACH